MTTVLFSQYRNSSLQTLAKKLDKDYYSMLEALCLNVSGLSTQLLQDEKHASTSLYISLSTKLIEQVNDLIKLRKEVVIPYIDDLSVKKDEGHDCSNCVGGCHIEHTAQIQNLKGSHKKIKEILFRLQSVALPLYTEADYPAMYKVLRNEMLQIDTALTELFYLEEAHLIPRVLEAQKAIHA